MDEIDSIGSSRLEGGSGGRLPCYLVMLTVLPAKSDSDFMFCLQSYQGLIIN